MNQQLQIDVNTLKDITCPCGSILFTQITRLKFISKLQSPDGKEGILKAVSNVCLDCGKPETEAIQHFEKQQKEEFESKLIQLKK